MRNQRLIGVLVFMAAVISAFANLTSARRVPASELHLPEQNVAPQPLPLALTFVSAS